MREIEWKLLSELMKNSRRSDRDLAKAIGASQPTVTRTRHKLEKEGYIKEYTMIPDFAKLGFQILALTFVRTEKVLTPEELKKARKIASKVMREGAAESIMLERGAGLEQNGVFMSIHKDYACYLEFKEFVAKFGSLLGVPFQLESFLIGLSEAVHYKPLTFSTLSKYLLAQKEQESKK